MKKLTVAFDCDGTLRHSVETAWVRLGRDADPDDVLALVDTPRDDVIELLKQFAAHPEFEVIVHSGGGDWYAQSLVDKLGLNDFVDAVRSKWGTRGAYDIAVDDQEVKLGKVNWLV